MIKFVITILLIFALFANRKVKSNRKPHIAGGQVAGKSQFPFFAQLLFRIPRTRNYRVGCGASLIQAQWIVSAAHCFRKYKPMIKYFTNRGFFAVDMGTNIRKDPDARRNNISEVYFHPKFLMKTNTTSGRVTKIKNDVVLARLKRGYCFDKYVQMIYLAPKIKIFDDWANRCSRGTVIGTGLMNYKKKVAKYVMYARPKIMLQSQIKPSKVSLRPETLMFTQTEALKGHGMRGDSGGPFVCYHHKTAVLYGVLSTGKFLHGHRNFTRVTYERIDKHLDFITKYVPGAIIY